MKKTFIAVLAAAMVVTGATAVSASGHHHMGAKEWTGVCAADDCYNNGYHEHNGTGLCGNAHGHHRGYVERNHEYCPYR